MLLLMLRNALRALIKMNLINQCTFILATSSQSGGSGTSGTTATSSLSGGSGTSGSGSAANGDFEPGAEDSPDSWAHMQ